MENSSGVLHGFLRSPNGTYIIFSLPAGTIHASVHMNDAGQIAGSYAGSNYIYYAFLRDTNGSFTPFSVSGAPTTVSDINQGGFIVGGYGARNSLHRGFLRRPDGTIVSLEYPGANFISSTTLAACINQSGTIAGKYQINTSTEPVTHGFVLTGVH